MKIAFWSTVHGQPGTTSNMVAIAAMVSVSKNMRCLLCHTHFKLNGLETQLIGNTESGRDAFLDAGLDGLIRSIKLAPLGKEMIDTYTMPLMEGKLTLLQGTTYENRAVFNEDMAATFSKIVTELEKYYDLVFIDTNSGNDKISRMVLDFADIIVVNLCQSRNVLDSYFSRGFLKNRRIMYLIGNYDKDSRYNIYNMKLLYKPLLKGIIETIPYNTDFMDAQSDGCVLKFMMRYMNIKRNHANALFVKRVSQAADKLMKMAAHAKGGIKNGR